MNTDEYLKLVEEHPDLTAHGFGAEVDRTMGLTYAETFEMEREALKRAFKEFQLTCDWIMRNPELKGRISAYHWKHEVENWLRTDGIKPNYIAQGVFILAALHMGYRIHRIRGSIGARIGKREVTS
jgi:hypothetical protein